MTDADCGHKTRREFVLWFGKRHSGGSKMARAVKDEILESLSSTFSGGERDAKKFMNKLKRRGLLSIEAWS